MRFTSLQPFIPSGPDFELARQLFIELGFSITWDAGDNIGFQKDDCRFILQRYDNKAFAENLMISVTVTSMDEFLKQVNDKQLRERFGVRFSGPLRQPYGMEVNMIDKAGVCWHFIED